MQVSAAFSLVTLNLLWATTFEPAPAKASISPSPLRDPAMTTAPQKNKALQHPRRRRDPPPASLPLRARIASMASILPSRTDGMHA